MTPRDWPDELVAVSEGMIRAGLDALREESFSTPWEELVDLIYTAMEYQRRREASSTATTKGLSE